MKKLRKYFVILLVIMSAGTAYGATYTLVTANYDIKVNNQKIAVEPLNYNGTTYLPLRQIAEAVGVDIGWNGATKSVEINTVDVEELKKACVMIVTTKGDGMMQGSGVYVDYDKILTAQHVIDGANRFGTLSEEFSSIISQNEKVDAALLKPKSEIKPVKIGDSDEVKPGDTVIVISSPGSKENTVTYTKVYENTVADEILISSTGLGAGSSGGAVFNTNGELLGIVCNMADKWCFARPINDIRKAL